MTASQRHPVPGGHSRKDGGFSLLEPSPAERDQTAGWVLACQQANETWLRTAQQLTRLYSLSAKVDGVNTVLHHAIEDAEQQYDTARAMAKAAIEQATMFLPENRADNAGRHRYPGA